MLPPSDGVHARRFPVVNVSLIAANFAVWVFHELPQLGSAVYHASFHPCTVDNACHGPEAWGVSTAPHPEQHQPPHQLGNLAGRHLTGLSRAWPTEWRDLS
jgi:hypothetical protein